VKPYPPTLKLQLRQRNGKFDTLIYDSKKRPLTDVPFEDILVKGAVMTALVQCTGVWFAGGKFGISWKAVQIRAERVPESLRDYGFVDGPGSAAPAAPAPAAPAPAAPANKFAALHDEEEEINDEEALAPPKVVPPPAEEEDEEEPAPVPAKKPLMTKKKIVMPVKK
jgi:hypothetical protein